MFGFLFGWRNASKCKKLVKQVQCRLKLLKNKRYTIVKHLRQDVAQLIKIGDEERALNRAEQICRDENLMAVYELLDHFCELIIVHLSYIRKHRELPNDINEAVSSLVFASARCGDLPELRTIRNLIGERYGQRFVTTAKELLPGNLVNREIKEKLSVIAVSDDMKYRLVDEIARDHCLSLEILALEYAFESHKEANERCKRDQTPGREIKTNNVATEPSKDPDWRGNDIISYSHQQSLSDVVSSSMLKAEDKQESLRQMDLYNETEVYKFEVTDLRIQERPETERIHLALAGSKTEMQNQASSPESSPRFVKEGTMVYPDDIEEMESSVAKDQRLFKFRSSVHSRRENSENNLDESLSERSGSRTPRIISGKRSRKRSSASCENLLMNDIECVIYYNKPCKNSPSRNHKSHHHHQRKHQKKSHMKQFHEQLESCYIVYHIFTYPDRHWSNPKDRSKTMEDKIKDCDSPGSCASSSNNFDRNRSESMAIPPYLRAKTMPTHQERGKEICRDGFVRSNSCTFRTPNHVHPKLPEYDEIAAKFMALRKEHLRNKVN